MFRPPNPHSGVPLYLQLMQQVQHAIETGVAMPGDQLPAVRKAAERLLVNVNTVIKAYRELEHLGIVELRQGAGAFINPPASIPCPERMAQAQRIVRRALDELEQLGFGEAEVQRLMEADWQQRRKANHGD